MKSLPLFAMLAIAGAAGAAPLSPVAYDMNNGHGQLNGGQFNYWDREYTGLGCTDCDNNFLSGGLGNLTDGVVTDQNWFAIENAAGTGPYVGWRGVVLPNLSVLFRFSDVQALIDTISIHADDSAGAGGVDLPTSVSFEWSGGSITRPVVDPDPGSGPSWLVFDQLGITNAQFVRVGFAYRNEWVFVDEVRFDGTGPAAPEPASAALALLGLAGVAGAARRRRR